MEQNLSDQQIRRKILAERRRRNRRRRMIAMCVAVVLAVVDGWFVGRLIGSRSAAPQPEAASPGTQKEIVSVSEDLPIINTALEQVGNKGGDKFWSWYGFDSHVAWCGCFVSWCENETGYFDNKLGPKFSVVTDGIDWFKARDQWLNSDATPSAGDFIFFDWEKDGYRDHVGIVTAVVGDKVFAVEGNSSDRCRMKRYTVGDPVIEGYGHPVLN